MKTKLMITLIALFAAMPALAEFTLVTEGAEVALSNIRLPQNDGGTIAYKPCDSCDYATVRVSPNAVWLINKQRMSLKQFRERIARVSDHDRHPATVTRHIESNLITKVSVSVRGIDKD